MIPLAASFVERLVEDVGSSLGQWAYLVVGVFAFLETGAFVGLIAPGETIVVFGGVLAGQGSLSVVLLVGLVWACAFLGDSASFLLGRHLGRDFLMRHGPRVRITPERLETVERYFHRHGGKTVLIGRFIGLVRALAPFLAGSSHMPYRRFAPYDIVGTGLWSATFTLLGYFFWQSYSKVAAAVGRGTLLLGIAAAVAVAAFLAYRKLREPERRRAVAAWLRRQTDRPVLRWARSPLRFVGERLRPGELGLQLTTMVAVAVVGAYIFGLYAWLIQGGTTATPADREAFEIAGNIQTAWLTAVMKAISMLGSLVVVGPVVALVVGYLVWRRRATEALVLLAGTVLTVIASNTAKAAIDRPRPNGSLVETASSSFPSGHAAQSIAYVAIAVICARVLPGLGHRSVVISAGIAAAGLIGLSRVYLRAHYLSDVTSGWALGCTVFALCAVAGLVLSHLRKQPVAEHG